MRFAALLLAFVLPCRAFATAQMPEILVLDGKKEEMITTPLEVYFKSGHERPVVMRLGISSSGLWREYIGTWEVKGDELYLTGLHKPDYDSDDRTKAGEVFPLTTVFPDAKGSVKARWYSGVLRVRRGEMLRYVHMGFASVYSKTLYLTVKEGRIIARKEIDNKEYGATRSETDMGWVALGEKPAPDNGDWVDARTLSEKPPQAGLKTRGVFIAGISDEASVLWIPETPTTEDASISLVEVPKSPAVPSGSHVEITGALEKADGGRRIKVESMRELKHGETMHHGSFEAPRKTIDEQQPAQR